MIQPHAGADAYQPEAYHLERLDAAEQQQRIAAFVATMARRRSVRQFSTEPVPFSVIEQAVRAAALAPSGANQQPWTFVVVSDPALKQQMRAAAEAEERENYQRRMSQEWKDALAPLGTGWQKPHITDAPSIIVVFEQTYGLTSAGARVKHYYVRESVGIAAGMLLAALTHAGLATLTHTPSPMGFLGELLGRPPNERPFLLIPVGYPAPDATVPAITKKPLGQVLIHHAAGDAPTSQ
jgi:iodotyrosine deiodinase